MAYEKVTLTGTYQTPDGTPHKGHVEIIPSERVIKDTTGDVILTGRVKVDLDAQGAFTVALPATDDPTLNPTGFGYTIAAKLHSSHPPAVSFSLPASLGATTVEDLTPVDPATFEPTTTYAESSEVAALDTRVTTLETTPTVTSYNDLTDTPTIPTTPTEVGAEPAGLSTTTNDALAATFARVSLDPTREYAWVACVLRNEDAPTYWQPVDDGAHRPIHVASVTTDADTITVNYDFDATTGGSDGTGGRVIYATAECDESMTMMGYAVGASVNRDNFKLTLVRERIGAYIAYNGSSWDIVGPSDIGSDVQSVSFSGGILTVNHDPITGVVGGVDIRNGAVVAQLGQLQPTQTQIILKDFSGALITTPNTDMRVYFFRQGGGHIDPRPKPRLALHNLWCSALVELPH